MMTPKQQVRVGDLDLSVTDPFERTTQYIYDEIFVGGTYDHPQIKLPERATIIDVGANVGLFTIWAARKHSPRTILAYEASPITHECLVENVARHVDSAVTRATCINLTVSREAGRKLVLHQPPWVAESTPFSTANTALDRRARDRVSSIPTRCVARQSRTRPARPGASTCSRSTSRATSWRCWKASRPPTWRGAQHRAGGGVRRGAGALPRPFAPSAQRASASRRGRGADHDPRLARLMVRDAMRSMFLAVRTR